MSSSQDGDDRTVNEPRTLPLGPGSVHAPVTVPGRAHGAAGGSANHALPLGTRLGEFELTQEIGEGGFSIVYLAWDQSRTPCARCPRRPMQPGCSACSHR